MTLRDELDQLRHKINIRMNSRYDEQMVKLLEILIKHEALPPLKSYKGAQIIADKIMGIIENNPAPYASIISCIAEALPRVDDEMVAELKEAFEELQIMFRQLETIHDNTAYVENSDFVGIDANLDNVSAAIKRIQAAIAALTTPNQRKE